MNALELADLAHRHGARVSHESAAGLWGFRVRNEPTEPRLIVPRNRSHCAEPGVVIHRADLKPADCRVRDGVPVTAPLRTAMDLARALPLEDAVVVVDAALESKRLQAHQCKAAMKGLRGPGAGRIRAAFMAADGRSQSVPETLLRIWLSGDSAIGPVIPQMRLCNGGHPYDLGCPRLRAVAEFQSWEWHQERSVWVRDARWGNQAYGRAFGYVQFVHEDVLLGREHARSLMLGS